MTTVNASAGNPQLFIAVNKNRVRSSYKDGEQVVFLPSGTEFQLELFNLSNVTQKAEIFINGKMQNYGLVLRPGEHYYLDRFMDEDRKLKFDTYEVEDSQAVRDAIAKNGLIEVRYYPEQVYRPIQWITYNNPYPYHYPYDYYTTTCASNTFGTFNNTFKTGGAALDGNMRSMGITEQNTSFRCSTPDLNDSDSIACACNNIDFAPQNTSIETGRVEAGGKSNQSFQNYSGNFQSWPTTTIKYHILPVSQKPAEMNTGDIRTYCTQCGRRIKNGWQFCAGCGQKV